ncbi:PDZ domain-containing protein [Patescibacteria group bacterium]|nr:PDZ domain-containing protein [Patescibacteria group bacterium]MBU1907509.1 PDZ domain-containing protein [Patescibacteria group bacterium]
MLEKDILSISRTAVVMILSAVTGALSGAAVALYVTPITPYTGAEISAATSTNAAATSTAAELSLVKVESKLLAPLVPPAFFVRRASPVATLYKKPKGKTVEERSLGEDKILGQAVALTSDGWFVTTVSVFGQNKPADISVWLDGASYAFENVVADSLNQTLFFKLSAKELTASAFGQVVDLLPGSETWLEKRPSALAPSIVVSLQDNLPVQEPAESEVEMRRIRLTGYLEAGDQGSPVWSAKGALLGLLDGKAGDAMSFVPASGIYTSFNSLLSQQVIRHAYLGVRSVDLSAWRIDGDRAGLPAYGAYIKGDKKTGKPAVVKDSPAAKAGLLEGDVILSVDRDILDGTRDLGEVLSEYRPDMEVTLHISRQGQESDLKVQLGSVITGEVVK